MARIKRDEKGLRIKYGVCKTCLSERVRVNHYGECESCREKAREEAIQCARIAVHETYSNIAWPGRLAKTHADGASWRVIAEAIGKGVTVADVYRYASGKEPKSAKKRAAFDLPQTAPAPVCPIHGGVDCLECGKQQRAKGKPRVRLVAQVDADTHAAVHAAASLEGVTAADWLRRVVGEALMWEEE